MSRARKHLKRKRVAWRFTRTDEDGGLPAILFNPVYGYGRWLEPREVAAAQVFERNVALAARQRALGRSLTLEELDAEFTALMDDLVSEGLCQRMEDLPPLVPKATWLRAQQVTIRRLMAGEEL